MSFKDEKAIKKTIKTLNPWFRYDTQFNDIKLELLRCLYPSTNTDLTKFVEYKCVKPPSPLVQIELAGSGKVVCYGFDLSKVYIFIDLKQKLYRLLYTFLKDECNPTKIRLFDGHGGPEVKSLLQAKKCDLLVLLPVDSIKSRINSLLKDVNRNYEKNIFEALETFLKICLDPKSGRIHGSYESKKLLIALEILKMNQSVFESEKFKNLLEYQQKEFEQCEDTCIDCGKIVPYSFRNLRVHKCAYHCKQCKHCGKPKTTDLKAYLEFMNGNLDNNFLSLMIGCSNYCKDGGDCFQCGYCGEMKHGYECYYCGDNSYSNVYRFYGIGVVVE